MEPEKADGNVEYKLKLINKDEDRIESLASQMRFRCDEGNSECIYKIGLQDDGTEVGITEFEFGQTIKILNSMAKKNNYSVNLLYRKAINNKFIYTVLVREINDEKYLNVNVSIAGSVDAGKSSFVGVLTSGNADDGRGLARLSVFNFEHEIRSGRTSSVGQHIVGFDLNGKIINYKSSLGKNGWLDIVKKSKKIISFFDLAGHEKYLKTTILGLSCSFPDLCLIMVAANRGVLKMTKEHIFLCIALKIPFVIVITKIDMVKNYENVMKETTDSINIIAKSPIVNRIPLKIKDESDCIIAAEKIHTESIIPIFSLSNVTREGFNNFELFLNLLAPKKKVENTNVEFHIESIWNVNGIGLVVGGNLISGKISVNDNLYVGPIGNKYVQTGIKSIHCKRVPVQEIESGCYVTLALKKIDRNDLRKGNVLVSTIEQGNCCFEFKANIKVLRSHSTTIKIGYEPIVHVFGVRQTATLVKIENKTNARNGTLNDDVLRTGDAAEAWFKFCYHAEFMKTGSRLIFCEGSIKVIGVVTEIKNV